MRMRTPEEYVSWGVIQYPLVCTK